MKNLTEREAEDFLEKSGFNVIKREYLKNKLDVASILKKINFPWAMKLLSNKITHKRKEGGVVLNVRTISQAQQVISQFEKMPGYISTTIQPMFLGKELILGVKDTKEFGRVIMVGKGGSNVEKDKDVSFRVLPIKEKEAKEMIKELRCYKNISRDSKKIVENLLLLSKLVSKNNKIKELDINPLMIAKKPLVIDARISLN
jgi:acetate---CoA ligase (ADP-forming) subunit beta